MIDTVLPVAAVMLIAPTSVLAAVEMRCLQEAAGVESDLEHLPGVLSAEGSYRRHGGSATYQQVSSETTGHQEAVRVRFDPAKIGYASLLRSGAMWIRSMAAASSVIAGIPIGG